MIPFHLFNLISGALPARSHRIRSWLLRRCGCAIGSGVCLNAAIRVYSNNLEIGNDSWIGSESAFFTGNSDGRITIGSRCDIGPGVYFVTGSHEIGDTIHRAGKGSCRPITIGDGCWIGAKTVILGGVSIGEGCVVAAGSLVLPGEYSRNTLIAGVPAKIRKTLPEKSVPTDST